MKTLDELQLTVTINKVPNEIQDPIPFDEDEEHRSYDREYANRFWRVLVQSDRVFKEFRSRFCGKCSPVHSFWGSFDLAVTRFSGRSASPHPGGIPHLPDAITREAYSQEVSSLGFWPGNASAPTPIFYSYAYPEPPGFAEAKVQPAAAFYEPKFREFMLPYDEVRTADNPDQVLLEFAHRNHTPITTTTHTSHIFFFAILPTRARSLRTMNPGCAAEQAAWREVKDGWRPLYGDVDKIGVAIEWHDFRIERAFNSDAPFIPIASSFA